MEEVGFAHFGTSIGVVPASVPARSSDIKSALASNPKKHPCFCQVAEEVGFEPTELSFNGFQDRRLKPLGHSSVALDNK